METVGLLLLIPLVASVLVLFSSHVIWQYLVTGSVLGMLSLLSIQLFLSGGGGVYAFDGGTWIAVIVLDIVLLLYFAFQGFRYEDKRVWGLALLQMLLYILAEANLPKNNAYAVVMDELSRWMFLVINIVGGIIVVYAVRYMQSETVSPFKKRLFIAYLMIFLAIMNLIVMANSIMLFFFLFEMTTLASYLLIGFRGDELARNNALQALWMNQVGGVAILGGALFSILYGGSLYFDTLLSMPGAVVYLPVAFFAVAAFVKGAAIPFERWLLGAMVAPTPVSAMLHSATMVKIAPFLILKLSPVLAGSVIGGLVSVTGALVFAAASYLALSKEMLKEILGLSTIAMLGLMVSMAAIGSEEAVQIALILILFHALGKALLFMTAGVIEKTSHVKNIEEMKGLWGRSPSAVFFLLFGFMSMTLPPFGLFVGKVLALESIIEAMHGQPLLTANLLAVAVGSVLLTLLYFKIASALLSPDLSHRSERSAMGSGFAWGLYLLSFLILFVMMITLGALIAKTGIGYYAFGVPLAIAALLPLLFRRLARFDRAREYHCGEQSNFDAALLYYELSEERAGQLALFFGGLLCLMILAGVMS